MTQQMKNTKNVKTKDGRQTQHSLKPVQNLEVKYNSLTHILPEFLQKNNDIQPVLLSKNKPFFAQPFLATLGLTELFQNENHMVKIDSDQK